MRNRQSAITIFAAAVVIVLVAAIATTLHHVDTPQVSTDVAPGTIGLARPHAPLDRAPGQPVFRN
jgi:hypothetical protein